MDVLILLQLPGCYRVEWRGEIMLTSLDAERMKKDQLHVENTDGISSYFNNIGLSCELTTNIISSNGSQLLED